MPKIKPIPCGVCGELPVIVLTDDEGNVQAEWYLDNPYSGVSYSITHPIDYMKNCPLATHHDNDGFIGRDQYLTKEDAIKAWNSIWKANPLRGCKKGIKDETDGVATILTRSKKAIEKTMGRKYQAEIGKATLDDATGVMNIRVTLKPVIDSDKTDESED